VGNGTLTFIGDGPLRAELAGRNGVHVAGRLPYEAVPGRIAAAHVVCQPSLIEPFGQAILEAMACGRSVVATRIGGPPEFVPPEAGVLVDPADEDALAAALAETAAFPCPNPAARVAAEAHDVRAQAEKVERILVRAARDPRA
jgi:glycosyltransferase involved in cell wall biosynthesis